MASARAASHTKERETSLIQPIPETRLMMMLLASRLAQAHGPVQDDYGPATATDQQPVLCIGVPLKDQPIKSLHFARFGD